MNTLSATRPLFKARLPLLALLLVFCAFKWPHLHTSFYWDESWSYAPGVRLMYNHGPSLLPNAIDVFYSRGHPLFFYAGASAWMHATGGYSHFNAHLYAFVVTLCLLATVYEVMLRWSGWVAAFAAATALAFHVGFFVQAAAVVPEMMVALFSLLSIYAFAIKRFWVAGIALTALLFTKESGIIAALVLGLSALLLLFSPTEKKQTKIAALVSVLVPGGLIIAFFLLQKHYLGWYLYPEHTGMIQLDWPTFYGKFYASLGYLLAIDGPRWIVKAGVIAGIAAGIRIRRFRPVVPVIVISVAYLIARDKLNFLPEKLRFGLLVLVLCAAVGYYLMQKNLLPTFRHYVSMTALFVFAYLCFCCINFFTLRYLLAIIVPVMMGLSGMLVYALRLLHPKAVWVGPVIILLANFFMFRNDKGLGDVNLQSFNAMEVQDSTTLFLEQQQWFDKKIATGSFQEAEHLKKPYAGFLHTPRVFSTVDYEINDQTEVVIFNNIEPDLRLDQVRGDERFQRVYQTQKGDAWAEIYVRKMP